MTQGRVLSLSLLVLLTPVATLVSQEITLSCSVQCTVACWISKLSFKASAFDRVGHELYQLFKARLVCIFAVLFVVLEVCTSDFQSEGYWFKARLVSSFLCYCVRQETLLHIVSLHPDVHV